MGFVLGVVSSMVASILLIIIGYFNSTAIRRYLIRLLSRLTGVGVEDVYATQQTANANIHKALADASWVKVLAGRGNELTRDSFATIWADHTGKLKSISILLPHPDSKWLTVREGECAKHDHGYGGGVLSEQVRSNLKYLQHQALSTPNVDLRTYDFPQLCRIIATDQVAYLTPYAEREHGRNSTCFVLRRSSPIYEFALRMFDSVWREATKVNDPI
jgi:hypothetical protein